MDEIKVSVIIPVYNVENYIEECITSVINQTLRDIEIICVNDGSTDGSTAIMEEFHKKDSRIRIINQDNAGLSVARNTGIENAVGEYIYFLDSDDFINSDTLEVLYGEAKKYDLDNIYFDGDAIYENEELEITQKSYKTYYKRPAVYQEVVPGTELFTNMELVGQFRPSACLQMPRRALLMEHNLRFYPGILHEDNLFSVQVVLLSKKVKHIPKSFFNRRVRESSIMTGRQEFRKAYGYYVSVMEFMKFAQLHGFEGERLWQAIIHRLCNMQSNGAKAICTLTLEEIDKMILEIPEEQQLTFSVMMKKLVEYKQTAEEKRQLMKEQYEEKLNKLSTSSEYRLGKAILCIPKKVRRFGRSAFGKGILCTLYGVKRKICREKKDLSPAKICVSIIIPVYNGERYLKECLNSLLAQTLQSIEIICVNDGSTDSTPELLEQYAKKDVRIRVLHQEKQGAGPARNYGMSVAKGEYLLFLDADDTFHSKLCELAYYKCKYDMADMVVFGASRMDMQTGERTKMTWVLREELLPEKGVFSAKDTNEKIFQIVSGCPWSKMFKRSFVEKNHLQWQNLRNANDVFFVRSALTTAKRITSLKRDFVLYRYNDGANTQSTKAAAPIEFYKAFKALKEDLKARGLFDKVERSYVNMVLAESLFNLRTAGTDEAKRIVYDTLIKEAFPFYELDKYDASYFYNHREYEQYQAIVNGTYTL